MKPEFDFPRNGLWHWDCYSPGMMTLLLILLALAAAGLITELVAAATAPLGYQDDYGFHFGCERTANLDEFEGGNPS